MKFTNTCFSLEIVADKLQYVRQKLFTVLHI